MKTYACTQERFAGDVGAHVMTVVRADGVDRHLRFRKPGSSSYWFDIITWQGTLCIDGDCGTYVFRRLTDMFEFFRTDRGEINPSYWAEKVVSGGRRNGGGIEEFDADKFRAEIVRQFRDHFRDSGEFREALQGFKQLRQEVLSCAYDGEHAACQAAYDFTLDGRRRQLFEDISSSWFTEYTFHFIWCLRAIVWAIQQWDASQTKEHA